MQQVSIHTTGPGTQQRVLANDTPFAAALLAAAVVRHRLLPQALVLAQGPALLPAVHE